jgi:hypothetical protein
MAGRHPANPAHPGLYGSLSKTGGKTMRGFLYRLAVAVRDLGERRNMPRLVRAALALRGCL